MEMNTMDTVSKFENLINILIQQTNSNTIRWNIGIPPKNLSYGTDDFFPLFLYTEYQSQSLGLYLRRYRYYHDESEYSWCEDTVFCIIKDDYIVYKYEKNSPALLDLFDKASQQVSGIDNLFK
ncbi:MULTISPECIES: hypothetical protein [Psychrobacter]|jgi:hypothetical protein|uniref:hypothetical protein n=1 Tax=Psychrobacter TaxID=497 RepID=UPI000B408EC1|nr:MULTISPECIES: hypothetical protein [Psychrobacter]MCG3872252.1 hypothetical protein [Psychrobacter sp. Ps7]